ENEGIGCRVGEIRADRWITQTAASGCGTQRQYGGSAPSAPEMRVITNDFHRQVRGHLGAKCQAERATLGIIGAIAHVTVVVLGLKCEANSGVRAQGSVGGAADEHLRVISILAGQVATE